MAESTIRVAQQQTRPINIQKWKVSEGSSVSIGGVLLLYDFEGAARPEKRKFKAGRAGQVYKILAQEGAIVKPGETLCELRECTHPTIMNDMCAECGTDLRKNEVAITASVPMVHAIPDLKVSEELARKLGKADADRLLKDRKLVLLVDLDQTLIHTTNDNIPANIKDVYHFQLYGPNSPWYHTRLRPGTHDFLENVFPMFELHICTFGARNYAHMIAAFLDCDQRFFSNRILSRDECFDPTSKKANLKALFPCGDNMVCIIDDREDVWSHAANLIHVKPYHFFQHTGDINAPPGLDKQENDDKAGVDLTKICADNQKQNNNGHQGEDVVEKPEPEVVANNKKSTAVNGDEAGKTEKENEDDGGSAAAGATPDPSDDVVKNSDDVKVKVAVGGDVETSDSPSAPSVNNKEEKDIKGESTQAEEGEKLIEIEDPDDYLLHLEDVLRRIHRAFYEDYDRMESGEVPDLKKVIPTVRGHVLNDCKLVFSGLVPTHIKLNQSKAYKIARSLGADVTQEIDDATTHLVAVRPGTAKVNAGRRKKKLKIVTPDWLWSCAERWEHVDEKIFPLNSKGSKNRHPPPHCTSPEHHQLTGGGYPEHSTPASRKRTPSGRFMDTINPLMSFSSADIADMDKEVEDILDDESDSSEEDPPQVQAILEPPIFKEAPKEESSSSTSSEDSMTGEFPKGYKRRKLNDGADEDDIEKNLANDLNNSTTEEDETLSAKFRRGEEVGSDLDLEPDSQDSEGSLEPPDDDGEWNMMGAALEREFLSNN